MKRKRGKLVITFIIANIVMFLCTFFAAICIEASKIVEEYNQDIDELVQRVREDGNYWGYESDNEEIYIDGKLNEEYMAKSVDTYQRIANTYYHRAKSMGLRMYGATLDESREILAESGNKIIFMDAEVYDNGEVAGYKYRFFDYGKLLSDQEISSINQFFKYKSGYLYMWGQMDDTYVYPEYIALGDIWDYTTYEDIYFNTDNLQEDSYDNSDEAMHKHLFIYGLDRDYSCENADELIQFTTYNEDNSLFLAEDREYVNISDVTYFSVDVNESESHITFPDITKDVLYKNAKANLLNADDLSDYCNNNIFDYERICVTECYSEGNILYECFSFEGRPFDVAVDRLSAENYIDIRMEIFMVMLLFNMLLFIFVRVYLDKKSRYEEYAKDIFYEITDKLTEPISQLKRLNEEAETEGEGNEHTRELIDKAIITMDENIRDILNLSKIEAGILSIEVQELELGYLVESLIKNRSKDYGRNIVTDIDREAIVYGDVKKIASVIDCFICNVVQKTYSDENVYVTVKGLKGRVHFEVTNNEKYVMKKIYIGGGESRRTAKVERMEHGGVELLLAKGYLDLHNAHYIWSNEEGKVKYAFELSDKELTVTEKKKTGSIGKIYGIVSHEIKTPMNVIKLHNEVIREGILDAEDERRYKEIIAGQIDIIQNQLEQMGNAKNLESGNTKLSFEWVDIVRVIQEAISRYKVLIQDKGIEITLDLPEENRVIADKTGIESIISNYIINAIKYTNIGGKIHIKVQDDGKYVIVKIINDRVLAMDGDDSRSHGDARIINRIERDGIGLLIAKKYLKMHRAKYGCTFNEGTVEYWFSIKKVRGV